MSLKIKNKLSIKRVASLNCIYLRVTVFID